MTIKADQVSDAFVAVPGSIVTMLDSLVAVNTTSGTYVDVTGANGTFVAPVAGLYQLAAHFGAYGGGASQIGVRFRLVFDVGTGSEQNVGDDYQWELSADASMVQHNTAPGKVELTAGSHTVKLQWKRVYGTDAVYTGSKQFVQGALVTGSGAGGVLLGSITLGSEILVDTLNPSYEDILSLGVTTVANEAVDITALVPLITSAGGGSSCFVRLSIDGTDTDCLAWGSFAGSVYAQLNFSYRHTFALAGAHVIKLQGSYAVGTWRAMNPQTKLFVTQFRGGLVPWEVDGVAVAATPRAVNVDGATGALSLVDNKLSLSLPKAVTAPGDLITALNAQPSTAISTSSATHVDMNANLTGSFSVKQAGTYRIRLEGQVYGTGFTSYEFARFRIGFDVGTGSEQYIGGSDTPSTYGWDQPMNVSSSWHPVRFEGVVTFAAAGSHTFKVQWARPLTGGGGTINCNDTINWRLFLESITGSGAGGALLDSVFIADVDVTVTEPTWQDLATFSPVYVASGERIKFNVVAQGRTNTAGTAAHMKIRIWDSTTSVTAAVGSIVTSMGSATGPVYEYGDPGFSFIGTIGGASGNRTYILQAQKFTGSGANFRLNFAHGQIIRYRGGLVPIKQDGVLLQDKPIAVNFIGPGITAANSGGQINVTVSSPGNDWKQSVKVATIASLTLATDLENGDTVDGITLATNDRVLVKDQGSAENGIYVVQASGAPVRASDMDTGSSAASAAVFVEQGTYAEKGLVCSNNEGSAVVGTHTLLFTQFTELGPNDAGVIIASEVFT